MTSIKPPQKYAEKVKNGGRHAFFLDIDGTMISELSGDGVSPRLAKAISDAQKKGHLFFVNSGRAIGYIPQALLESADFDGVVSGMGAHIIYKGEPIYRSVLPFDVIEDVADYCEAHDEDIIFEGESDETVDGGRYSFGKSGIFEVRNTFHDKKEFLEAIRGKIMVKMTTAYYPCEEYAQFLEKYFEVAYIPPIYSEGGLKGHNKGTAIRKVCDILGIPYENTVAVGDSDNDVGMLSSAGISCAMGTAPDHLKDMCDIICDSVTNDGCAKLIEALTL